MKMVIQTFLYIRARPSLPNFPCSLHSKARIVLERFIREDRFRTIRPRVMFLIIISKKTRFRIDVIIADTRREEDTLITNEVGIFGTLVANGFLRTENFTIFT